MIPLILITITIICSLLSFTCGNKKSKNVPNQTNPNNKVALVETTNLAKIPADVPPVATPVPSKTVNKQAESTGPSKIAPVKMKVGQSKTALNGEVEWIDPNDPDNQGEVEFKDFDDTEVDAGGDSPAKNQDLEPAKWAVKEDQERNNLIQAGKLVKHKRDPEYATIAGDIPEIDMDPGYEEDESAKKQSKKPKNKTKQSNRKKTKAFKAKAKTNKKKSNSDKEDDLDFDLQENQEEKHKQIREGKLFVDKRDPMYVTIGANAGIPDLQFDEDENDKLKRVNSKVKTQKEEPSVTYHQIKQDKVPKANADNTYFTLDF